MVARGLCSGVESMGVAVSIIMASLRITVECVEGFSEVNAIRLPSVFKIPRRHSRASRRQRSPVQVLATCERNLT